MFRSLSLLRRKATVPVSPCSSSSQQHASSKLSSSSPHLSNSSSRSFGGALRRPPMLPSSLVSTDWVKENINRIKVVDGSWYMPADKRNPRAEFESQHLPGAVFFDMDEFSDAVGKKLGLREDDAIVIYDTKGVFSAPRVWYTFKVFGAWDVAVMNGGLPKWLQEKLPTEKGLTKTKTNSFSTKDNRTALVRDFAEMLSNATSPSPSFTVLDARSTGRFTGADPEPRPGISSGHIPHSINIPYNTLLKKDQHGNRRTQQAYIATTCAEVLKDEEELHEVFAAAGVDLSQQNAPIVTSCGTGVTASVIALALHILEHKNWAVYDGSWTEWAQKKGAPIEKAPKPTNTT